MMPRGWPISHINSRFLRAVLIVATVLFSSQFALAQFTQQGPKLVGNGAVGASEQGFAVALPGDGNTAIVGGPADNEVVSGATIGAAWVFTRSNGAWTQQGSKLLGADAIGYPAQGASVSLSADGNTAIVGGYGDNSDTGAAWVYTRSNGAWTQQGSKLVGTGAVGGAQQGFSIALSADGRTAIVGGIQDNSGIGASWVFTLTGGAWTQQGNKLVGTDVAAGEGKQGRAVALSGDGNTAIVGGRTAIVGGYGDNSDTGAAWVYTRSNGVWTQQGSKLLGTGGNGANGAQGVSFGLSVALSGDGNTAVLGGPGDDSGYPGAAWVFVAAAPSLQVTSTTNIAAVGNQGGPFSPSLFQYLLSASVGSVNYSISGLPNWLTASATYGTASTGTAVTFTVNANANTLAPGTYGPATITFANSDTGQGTQTRIETATERACETATVIACGAKATFASRLQPTLL
jgi:hypothetical protein